MLRILHLEDNQADAELVEAILQAEGNHCAVTCVRTGQEFQAELEKGRFDVILSDYSLPKFDGVRALAVARQVAPETPVIFVSGTIGEEAAVKALKQGATDCVLKEHLKRLPSAVNRALAETAALASRREAEAKIREQAALLEMAQDAIVVRDLEDRILYWNKSAERLYGWRADEVLGKNSNDFLYGGDYFRVSQANEQLLAQGEWTGELEQFTRDKKPVVVESRWSLVRDEAGRPKGKLIINTDVTERKKLETQFLRAQRLETIGALAGGIAHDLNNVLVPILLGSQYLSQRLSGGDARKMLETMQASALRGSQMIQQILAFARGVGGEPAPLDVGPLVAEIEKFARETFPRSISVENKTHPGHYVVIGNNTQLHQVLLNLAVNARDAMPHGGVLSLKAANVVLDRKITHLQPEPVSGAYIALSVSDTGHGIPPEMLEKVFEPFFTTKAPGKGTGLGLSTVQGIVKSHNGFLEVSSTLEKGTTFHVYLPAQAQPAAN
jgi:two-component system cell cycle sensor histidine kinase/response regulator CckA